MARRQRHNEAASAAAVFTASAENKRQNAAASSKHAVKTVRSEENGRIEARGKIDKIER